MKDVIFYSYYHESNAVGSLRSKALEDVLGDRFKLDIRYYKTRNTYRQSTTQKENRSLWLKKLTSSIRSIDESLFGHFFREEILKIIREDRNHKRIIYCTYKPVANIILGVFRKLIHGGYLVLEFRDLMSLFGRKPKISVLHQIDTFFEKMLLRSADLIVVVSKTQKEKLQQLTNKKIIVITNGVDSYSQVEPIKSENVSLLYAGSLSKDRDLTNILEWLRETDVRVYVATKRLPDNISGNKKIEHVGWLEEKALDELCKKVNGFILLEGHGEDSNENIPAKLFYYLKFRKTIIADIGVSSDIWGLSGIHNVLIDIKSKEYSELDMLKACPQIRELERRFILSKLVNQLDGL